MKDWRFITVASQIVIGLVFIIASLDKILSPQDFAVAVFRYQLLPQELINLVALLLPWLELVCGLVVIGSRRLRDAGVVLIMVMLVIFIVAMGINLARGVNIACGCFSADPDAEALGARNIARNIGLLFLCGVVLWQTRMKPTEKK